MKQIKQIMPAAAFIITFDESKNRNILSTYGNSSFSFEIPKEINDNNLFNILENVGNSFLRKNSEVFLTEKNLFNIKSDAKSFLEGVTVSKSEYVNLTNAVNQLLFKIKLFLKTYCPKNINVSEIIISDGKNKVERALLKTISSNIELFNLSVFSYLTYINDELIELFVNSKIELQNVSSNDFNKKSIIFTDRLSNGGFINTYISIENSDGVCFKYEWKWSGYISVCIGSESINDLEFFKTLINNTVKHLIGSAIAGK